MVTNRTEPGLKIECAASNFFFLKTAQMAIESDPNVGRTYFIHQGRIVAVAKQGGEPQWKTSTQQE